MRKSIAVLFENKVFSLAPNTHGTRSNLKEKTIQKDGDTYFYEDILHQGPQNTIYQYDPIESFARDERLKRTVAKKIDLASAKKIIVDGRYPDKTEFWITDGSGLNEYGELTVSVYDFYMEGGRKTLVDMIRDYRYSDAIPELREIMLHDDSRLMRRSALSATGTLDRQQADVVVNEILGLATDRYWLMDIISYMNCYSTSTAYVRNLHKKFEEYYLDYDGNYLSRKYFHTVPQSIVMVCSRIPSLGALQIIEEGIGHPYPHVEANAKFALCSWLERAVLSNDSTLINKAVEIGKKYDIGNYFESGSWKGIQKLSAMAEFF